MDEGDEYMPQCNQMAGQFSMGDMPGPPGGQTPFMGAGGLTPMSNPYEQQQQMMMMGQQQQQQQQVGYLLDKHGEVQTKAAAPKGRSKKKDMDPMQSMAAMSNNPMMRPSMHNNMYPPQQVAVPPAAGRQSVQQGHGQMGQYPGQQPMQGYPPGYGQAPRQPQQHPYPGGPYPQHGSYPAPNGGKSLIRCRDESLSIVTSSP